MQRITLPGVDQAAAEEVAALRAEGARLQEITEKNQMNMIIALRATGKAERPYVRPNVLARRRAAARAARTARRANRGR